MPYIQRSTDREYHSDLVDAIVQEFTGPQDQPGKEGRPVIIEESSHRGRFLHVSVIWDAWRDLAGETRGQIIMDAYEQHSGPEQALKITVAMGLTHEEARKLKVDIPV